MGAKESKPIYCCYLLNNWKYEKYISITEFKEMYINYHDIINEYMGYTYKIIKHNENEKSCHFYGAIVDFPNLNNVNLIAEINYALKYKKTRPLNIIEPLASYISEHNKISMSVNFNKGVINSGCVFFDSSFTEHMLKRIIKYMAENKPELPKYIKEMIKDYRKNDECVICTENFSNLKDKYDVLLCGHVFCNECISKIKQCPICKYVI